ncbi:density-regulated protein DRP1 [Irpex rosettiformis]|uniref:Density-regulated protein DRP1 n=1 Tax=Irpex rosettiformis TaxID=378272 RepID=A0ACB8U4V1_9APHY|nr:density-regulated protein DRP1 [Irpex rosettiformis]
MSEAESSTAAQAVAPVQVHYCEVCTFPLEYCEFGSSFKKCKESLQKEDPELYDKYYSDEALQAKLGTLSLEAQAKLEKEAAKKEAKAEAKADAALKKKLASQVTIKRIERNKRKHVTSVHGLEAFGVDLKKAAKQFAQKFATGASVTKNLQGQEEIIVQGDVSGEIVELIEEGVGVLKGIPIDNVVEVEDKPKKKGGD